MPYDDWVPKFNVIVVSKAELERLIADFPFTPLGTSSRGPSQLTLNSLTMFSADYEHDQDSWENYYT